MEKRNYLILGASGSIGSETAQLLLQEGHRVCAGVRDLDEASALDALQGADLESFDARDWDSIDALVGKAQERYQRIDGVAVCVGSILLKAAHLTSRKEFEDVIALNLSSCFATLRAVAKPMMKQGGSIVLVSSAAARKGFPNHEAIAAAKAGVIGLTLSAAATYATYGIRVNCVAPGLVRSKMSRGLTENAMMLKASQSMHALGRIGEAEEVARAIAWLLDGKQGWITGQTLGVDGGLGTLHSKKA
ncbi:SDR family oxidoreductase [Pelagicoccus sp. SDUM812003]|uniref:SDR family NAD(P)-dependent oxidoreductase n=1 Tax=Pelagicoccus sp. SDUM812003 TaxID=3041267 RepID=UPI00280DBEAC|nr:SDR family oxidoreductase [Pelagicoccus sp. SDUM812003]MDQ8202481.1 SDR family oxidoreductase [Pelagicoccus sp. SDUM812003]